MKRVPSSFMSNSNATGRVLTNVEMTVFKGEVEFAFQPYVCPSVSKAQRSLLSLCVVITGFAPSMAAKRRVIRLAPPM